MYIAPMLIFELIEVVPFLNYTQESNVAHEVRHIVLTSLRRGFDPGDLVINPLKESGFC
jgi:hypothetical protein